MAVHLSDILDVERLEHLVAEKYINVQQHPSGELVIYNYAAKAQYEWKPPEWPQEALICRGLIVRRDDQIVVARPFAKFFNWGEYEGFIPPDIKAVHDKIDGSLGILYCHNGVPAIATRGSFTSDQAIAGTEILLERYLEHLGTILDSTITLCFEIIYPENRIVVNYGDTRDLYLLGGIWHGSGEEADHHTITKWPGPRPRTFSVTDFDALSELEQEENREGFVVSFHGGLRLKVKFDEYLRLHRILTNVSNVTVWEYLAQGADLNELLDRVPDEFHRWLKGVADELQEKHAEIRAKAFRDYYAINMELTRSGRSLSDRKAFALEAKEKDTKSFLFAILDHKDIDSMIWRMVRPGFSKAFKAGADDDK